ncbi:MAG: PorV/PorQ family protein [Candidatus Marinimicrobia bacterium]|nr:PorV/PorQ family protein [Candidatus Neomarinimicrobiota bacterium]
MKKIISILTLTLCLTGGNLFGSEDETGGYPGAFLQGGIGARAIAMGNSFSAIADDGTALFWNPAGLPLINGYEISLMHSMLFEDRAKNYASMNIPMGNMAISGGWLGFNVSQIQERNSQGQFLGHFEDSENVFFLGAGAGVVNSKYLKLNVGATGKYFYHSLYDFQATGVGADFGALLQIRLPALLRTVSVAGVVQNVNSSLQWDTESNLEEIIPLTYRVGVLADMALLPFKVTVDLEKHEKQDMRIHAGAEFSILNTLFFRAGLNDSELTAGAGLQLQLMTTRVLVDYAYATDDISENPLHYFTVGFGF